MSFEEGYKSGLNLAKNPVIIALGTVAGGVVAGAAWAGVSGAAFAPSIALFTISSVSTVAMNILIEKIAPKESYPKLHMTIDLLSKSLQVGAMVIAALSLGVFGTTAASVYVGVSAFFIGINVIILGDYIVKDCLTSSSASSSRNFA